jgi:2,3-bisphosphoglycerate-dependent phosphoglycerate mutase
MQKYRVVFLRHGESSWNKENRFTGWTDVRLSHSGIQEAAKAGKILKQNGFAFDVCYTSVLSRAIQTFNYAADELDCHYIPVIKDWRLN